MTIFNKFLAFFFLNFEFSFSEFFSGRFDTSGSMVPRLVPEISSKCAFCDGGAGGVAVGIGDSRSLMGTRDCVECSASCLGMEWIEAQQ